MTLPDGTYGVPPGYLAAVVTHLEMRSPAPPRPAELPEGCVLRQVPDPAVDWYRDLFVRIGGMDWMWFSRLRMAPQDLSAILRDPAVQVMTLERDGRAEAMLELDFREPGACELKFLGVSAALIGTTAGRCLVNLAVSTAFARPVSRLHLHTCTLDHPRALAFYLRSGFVATRREVEVFPDPRQCGELPESAAPGVPVIPVG